MINVRTEGHDVVIVSGSGHSEREMRGQDFDIHVTTPDGKVSVALFYGNAVWNVQVGRSTAWPVNIKPFGVNGVLISILSPVETGLQIVPRVG